MSLDIKKAAYYNITVNGSPGDASRLLSVFAEAGVNLLAFKAVPADQGRTRFSLFPDDSSKMTDCAKKAGLTLDGPYAALIIKGYSDESGELAGIFEKLFKAGIQVIEASGIADIKESYGVVLYLAGEECEKALATLGE